jgi:DNA-dependent RNA polymerase auxiliary subunit epsilon
MATVTAQVRYRYRKSSTSSWTGSGLTLYLTQQSETIVMQKLRERHKGYEIELVELKWR